MGWTNELTTGGEDNRREGWTDESKDEGSRGMGGGKGRASHE